MGQRRLENKIREMIKTTPPTSPEEKVEIQNMEGMFDLTDKDNPPPTFIPTHYSHLTIVDTIYYQQGGDSTVSADSRYTRWMDSEEQHYNRQLKIGMEWEKLNVGWISDCGMLMIKNREGTNQKVHPSEEEKEDTANKVLEIGVVLPELPEVPSKTIPFAIVLPGESLRFHPYKVGNLYVRCKHGPCRIIIDAFPE